MTFTHLRTGKTKLPSSVMYQSDMVVQTADGFTFASYDFETTYGRFCGPLPYQIEEKQNDVRIYDDATFIAEPAGQLWHMSAQDIIAGWTSRKEKLGKKLRGAQKWRERPKQPWQERMMRGY